MRKNKRRSVPPDGYFFLLAEDVALKKHNTHSEKYEGSSQMGIVTMDDSSVLKKIQSI